MRYHCVAHNEDWSVTIKDTDSHIVGSSWAEDMSKFEYVEFATVTDRLALKVETWKHGKQV